ncbi:MAG: FAD-dependent oxidoreductase [Clostridiales bacterium]|nr:FAD-dependent oxidoreductase [Clostridiales bacterium]
MVHLNIDGREITAWEGQTILTAARENGIDIPTLCHDDRVKTYGACGLCLAETDGAKLLRTCSTAAAEGMIIRTNTLRIRESRRNTLELLLSDHAGDCRAPCMLACPAQTDCQGYAGLIANGQFREALALIKDKIPLPASIGRVCPHPCETACRRRLVEEPVSILQLKRFAADADLASGDPYRPPIQPGVNRRVAVIGGGPGGLSAAYFLRQAGHAVTVYDAMPKMGGMLRYGIPEYRLPKRVLDEEIQLLKDMGIAMIPDVRIGRGVTLEAVRNKYDAVIIAIGAWRSTKLGCPGEDLNGVIGGIDFLREPPRCEGKKIAVAGGGNTAMDACRTAIRLGAEKVTIVYRRSREEMPADKSEIEEAGEEGVLFEYLVSPAEILGENEKVTGIRLQKMRLGDPDASGRRSPVPIEGAEEMLEADLVIAAIGQGVNAEGFEALTLTRRKTILADENTFETNLPGVFAIGDATNKGAGIAIEAIGEAKHATAVIDGWLRDRFVLQNGIKKPLPYERPFVLQEEKTAADFVSRPKAAREKNILLPAGQRRETLSEIHMGYDARQAVREAGRCLECGCADYFECKLAAYAEEYHADAGQFAGEKHSGEIDASNPFFVRDPGKCILCGLCVRVCDEVMGRTALGLVGRGFDAMALPALGRPVTQSDCISCGQCVALCPTGALCEIPALRKPVPVKEKATRTVCSFCGVGCQVKLMSKGDALTRALPGGADPKILCVKGRFGFGWPHFPDRIKRLTRPWIRINGQLREASFEDAYQVFYQKWRETAARWGLDAIGAAISDQYTNEDIFAMREFARNVLKTPYVFHLGGVESGLAEVLGRDGSTTDFDNMERADVIVAVCKDIVNTHGVAAIRLKRAAENGARLILISPLVTQADEWASIKLQTNGRLGVLKRLTKTVLEMTALNRPDNRPDGWEALRGCLSGEDADDDIREAASLYTRAQHAVVLFNQPELTVDAARLLADMAVLSGHTGPARSGVIQLKENCNSQGLADLGVSPDGETCERKIMERSIRGLVVFGEEIPHIDTSGLAFLAVMDGVKTETAEKADVILPAALLAESEGTCTNTVGQVQTVRPALPPIARKSNRQILTELAGFWPEPFDGFMFVPPRPEAHTAPHLALPEADGMYARQENTHAAHSGFSRFLERKNLLR